MRCLNCEKILADYSKALCPECLEVSQKQHEHTLEAFESEQRHSLQATDTTAKKLFYAGVGVCVTSLILVLVGGMTFPLVDFEQFKTLYFYAVVAVSVITIPLGWKVRVLNPTGKWIETAFFFTVSFAGGLLGAVLLVNGGFDSSPVMEHVAIMVGKRTTCWKERSYYLQIPPWNIGDPHMFEVPVNKEVYENAVNGRTSIKIATQKGVFGLEWRKSFQVTL